MAKRYRDVALKPVQDERRELWRKHNSLVRTRPLLYVRWLAAWHQAAEWRLQCQEPFFRLHEQFLRRMLFQDTLGDDYVIEPSITQRATLVTPRDGLWGVPFGRIPSPEPGGAWKWVELVRSISDRYA